MLGSRFCHARQLDQADLAAAMSIVRCSFDRETGNDDQGRERHALVALCSLRLSVAVERQ